MPNLIELTSEAQRLLSLVENAGGELTPEIEAALAVNRETLMTKVDAYGYMLDRIPALAAYWKDQRDQAARVARGLEAVEMRIKDQMKYAMTEFGLATLVGDTVKFSISNSAPALILDESKLPSEYMMTVMTVVPDKEKIKDALLTGVEIPGARLSQGKTLRKTKSRKE